MDRDKLERVKDLLDRALDLPEEERGAFLDEHCEDEEVRAEVELLLSQEGDTKMGGRLRAASPEEDPDAGRVIDDYRLLRRIGEGGMGVVYEAVQEATRRRVAVKLIKLGMDSAEVVARFETERRALAKMDHPNVAVVLDAGTDDRGRPYFVMDFIEGEAITRYCDRRRLSTSERVELFVQVCRGVQHAHQKGVIHRDLKPGNVLVEERDGKPVPRIIDFGIARAVDRQEAERAAFTRLGQLIGTPEYMSPEQADARPDDIDTRTDVYSLGVLLYELLVGTLPFDPEALRRAGFDEIRRRIREETPLRPSTRVSTLGDRSSEVARVRKSDPSKLARSCRGDLDWITMKAMEKDRGRRYDSAASLAEDLGRYLRNEPVTAGPPSLSYRASKFVRRHRLAVLAAATVLVAILAGAAGTTVGMVRARAAEASARREALTATRVSDFLVGLFQVSDPGEARGNSITAREILDRGVEDIRSSLGAEPEVQRKLLETMGKVYRSLGLYRDAEPLLLDAVERSREAHGEGPELASDLASLGGLRILGRDFEGARAALEESVAIYDRLPAADPNDLAAALNNLATVLRVEGDAESAQRQYRKALELRTRALGPDHPDVAKVWNNLGALAFAADDLAAAEEAFRAALAIRMRALGEDHPDTASAMNNLANVFRRQGRQAEARSWIERALAIQERTLGPEHPNLAKTVSNLAASYLDEGDAGSAVPYLRRALAVQEKAFGGNDRVTRATASTLEEALRDLGRGEEADSLRVRYGLTG